MAQEPIQATVERLAQSSGGQILMSVKEGLRGSMKFYVGLFLLGFMISFPLTSEFIAWLVDDHRLPDGVEIIVISPVEFLFLQLRIAGYVGLTLVSLMIVYQVALHGLHIKPFKNASRNWTSPFQNQAHAFSWRCLVQWFC